MFDPNEDLEQFDFIDQEWGVNTLAYCPDCGEKLNGDDITLCACLREMMDE